VSSSGVLTSAGSRVFCWKCGRRQGIPLAQLHGQAVCPLSGSTLSRPAKDGRSNRLNLSIVSRPETESRVSARLQSLLGTHRTFSIMTNRVQYVYCICIRSELSTGARPAVGACKAEESTRGSRAVQNKHAGSAEHSPRHRNWRSASPDIA